jgi:pimeloyl-ACP methyl ester carboxylesterase
VTGVIESVADPGRRQLLTQSLMLGTALGAARDTHGTAAAKVSSASAGCGIDAGAGAAGQNRDAAKTIEPLAPVPIPPQAPAKSGLAQLQDVKLWYWDTGGHGDPVVLLHPMTGSALVWAYQQPVFAKAGYRVIGYSRRGFHGSETGTADQPGTASQDLHELLSALGIDQFHAVATAGGAFVAADYAVSHPERLLTLTLACSILSVDHPALTTLTSGMRTPGFETLPAYFRELGASYRACDPEGTERWKELERTSLSGPRVSQPTGGRLTPASLGRLTMPTLLIAGDSDLIAPPPVARFLARHIPNCRLEVIPECGHSAYWERPALFNDIVTSFLRESAPAEPAAASAAPSATHWARVNNTSLRYELTGIGARTVVLLHEMTMTLESWDYIMPALARSHRVLRYDLRGFGLSGRIRNDSAVTMDDEIEDLRALLDALHIPGPVTLVGGAGGANIALVFAAMYPERVHAVATLSAAITLVPPEGEHPPAKPPDTANSGAADPLEDVYPAMLRTDQTRFERFRSIQATSDTHSLLATAHMIGSFDYAAVLPRVRAPTLVVATALYKQRSLKMMQAIAEAIPRGRLEVLQTGHFASLESPELVTSVLTRFLQETDG